MISTIGRPARVDRSERLARRREVLLVAIGLVVLAAVGTRVSAAAPTWSAVAFLVLLVACVASLVRPLLGFGCCLFFTLVGDASTAPWWPFTKNLSSRESLMYLGDGLSINPLEILLFTTIVGFVLSKLVDPGWRFVRGALFWPVVIFMFFVLTGFAYGQFYGGGDRRIAIFEARPLLYIGLIYVLATNLLTTRRQYQVLLALSFVAMTVQSFFSISFYRGLAPEVREEIESLSDHAATITMNVLFVCLIAMLLLGVERRWKWLMLPMVAVVAYAYVISQRRAAMVALFIGIGLVAAITYVKRRRAFWFFAPTFAVLVSGFVAATWNAEGALGLASSAVKSVIAPESASAEDRSSDFYRELETYDLWFTIRQDPLTGVGFGHKFLQPRRLPDISFFEFWEYIPHNAMLWIWLKMGALGFVATLYMVGRAVVAGTQAIVGQLTRRMEIVTALAGLSYVIMFIVFAYVDIAWDGRSTVFLGFSLALCGDFVRAAGVDEPAPVAPTSVALVRV